MKLAFKVSALMVLMLVFLAGAAFAQDESMSNESMEEMSGGMQSMEMNPVSYNAGRNQIGFSLGPYYPAKDNDDPSDDEWETGADLTVTYTRLIGNHFAVETGLHSYATTFDEGDVEGERSTGGVEVMALYVPIHSRIMPYIGGGLGFYSNRLRVEVNDNEIVDEEGSAGGVVLKGGIRAHLTQRFFLGGFVKAWTNNQRVEFENGDEETLNFGGSSINFEVGLAF
jgi:hypothetical protein